CLPAPLRGRSARRHAVAASTLRLRRAPGRSRRPLPSRPAPARRHPAHRSCPLLTFPSETDVLRGTGGSLPRHLGSIGREPGGLAPEWRSRMRIAIVGLGRMGADMTRRLLRAGHDVIATDLDPDRILELREEGATGAGDLDAALAAF